jgi:tetratricopeptide (TPR) repeat protein
VVLTLTGAMSQERFGLAALPAVSTRFSLVNCLTELGQFSEGISVGEDALRLAEAAQHPFSIYQACRCLGVLLLQQGAWEQALSYLERCLTLCQQADLPLALPVASAYLGAAYAHTGRLAEALPCLEQGVTQGVALHIREYHTLRMVLLSEGYLLAARPHEAHPLALEALALARDHKERGTEAYTLRLLGALAAHGVSPDVTQATAWYAQAVTLAERLGMRPLLAQCYLGMGTLYGRLGQPEPAHTMLTTAATLFRAMGMASWLARAESALAL